MTDLGSTAKGSSNLLVSELYIHLGFLQRFSEGPGGGSGCCSTAPLPHYTLGAITWRAGAAHRLPRVTTVTIARRGYWFTWADTPHVGGTLLQGYARAGYFGGLVAGRGFLLFGGAGSCWFHKQLFKRLRLCFNAQAWGEGVLLLKGVLVV